MAHGRRNHQRHLLTFLPAIRQDFIQYSPGLAWAPHIPLIPPTPAGPPRARLPIGGFLGASSLIGREPGGGGWPPSAAHSHVHNAQFGWFYVRANHCSLRSDCGLYRGVIWCRCQWGWGWWWAPAPQTTLRTSSTTSQVLAPASSSNKHRYDTVTLIRPNLDQFGSISSNFVQFWRAGFWLAGLQWGAGAPICQTFATITTIINPKA